MSAGWDEGAWRRLAAELERWPPGSVTFWWRDDDAGATTPALARLLALATAADVPVALAVVPAWLTDATVRAIEAAPPGVVVLQHGYAHANHEPPPGRGRVRKAELGAARPVDVVLAELAAGWAELGARLPGRRRAVLVPPWNRIAPAVQAALPGAGYRTLSTFGPRPAAWGAPGLRLVNCHVDPIEWRRGRGFAGAGAMLGALAAHVTARRTGAIDPAEPTGLLTHHQDLSPAAWDIVAELLHRLRGHPSATLPPLDALLAPAP